MLLTTPAPVTHRTAEENLGLGYLAAVLREDGWQVDVVDGWLEGLTPAELAHRIVGREPALLGFACYRSNMDRAMETLDLVRAGGLRPFTMAGGYGPTFHTNEFLRTGVDVVVRGEGEAAVIGIARHLADGKPELADVPNVSYVDPDGVARHTPAGPKIPLDDLPDPARDTLPLTIRRRSLVHIQTARGCQASCTFCSIVAFERVAGGDTWRQRGLRRIVDELERLTHQGATHFKVIDDSLVEPPRDEEWCAALADEIARRGIRPRLRGSIRADRVNETVVAELARAGFFSFSCGIENFAETALRRMAKRADLAQNLAALDTFHRHGIYVQAGHILFDDRTTMVELEENLAMMRRYIWTVSKGIFTEMYAADGTNFTRRLSRNGLLESDPAGLGNNRYQLADPAVREVYRALKTWHKAHSACYDRTIDPISAPKALDADSLREFHRLGVSLREVDLEFFGRLMAVVGAGGADLTRDVTDLVAAELDRTVPWYDAFAHRVDAAYAASGLVYDGEPNPFIC
ncbi:radical SAM protein [Micromonospora sp. WMMA1996]|nr:radical SAM protein [Micromonospora sp. WMMA1996]